MRNIIFDIYHRFDTAAIAVVQEFEGKEITLPNLRMNNNYFVRAFEKKFGKEALDFFAKYQNYRFRVSDAHVNYVKYLKKHNNLSKLFKV